MMGNPFNILSLLWTVAPTALAYQVSLPSTLAHVVPECAQGCVEAFIETTYSRAACSDDPSLQCLCSKRSSSGYTIAEGTVLCMHEGAQNNFCPEIPASALNEVYELCDEFSGAIPNQHTVLSAPISTISSGSDFVIVLPTSTETSSSTTTTTTTIEGPGSTKSTTTKTTTSSTEQTSLTSSSSSSPVITPPPTATTATTASSSVPTSTETMTTQPSSDDSPSTLQSAQVAGISIGIAGAIVLALGAIFLARRMRKRNFPDLDDYESGAGLGKPSPGGPDPGSRVSRIFHISPPIFRFSRPLGGDSRFEDDLPPPPPVYSSPAHNSMIGVAISRPRSESIEKGSPRASLLPSSLRRKPSKLLPAKPNLTLTIPPAAETQRQSSTQPSNNDRSSMMTNVTAFADLDEAEENGQIWRPPPSAPQSANAVYVADKWGNWVLSSANRTSQLMTVAEPAELDTYTPLTKSPIEKQEEQAATAMSAAISAASRMPGANFRPAFLAVDPASRGALSPSRSSSVYSQASARRQKPKPYDVSNSYNNNKPQAPVSEIAPMPPPKNINRANSRAARDSVHTIDSTTSGPLDDDQEDTAMERASRLSALSPVIESPLVGIGRRALANPRIPGRFGGATIRQVPPPRRPNFSGSPPGQPSPTLGGPFGVIGTPSAYPAPLNPQRHAPPPGLMTSGSGFSPIPPAPPFPVPSVQQPQQQQYQHQYQYQYQHQYQHQQQHQQQPQAEPQSPQQRLQRFQAHVASQHISSPISAVTTSSATSSLLAKRVGNDRAAALALDPNGNRGGGPWKRHEQQQAGGGPSTPDPSVVARMMPVTPTWQPRLTPTRRGDDLFLNVL